MPHLSHAKITELFKSAKNMKNKKRRDETLIEIRVGINYALNNSPTRLGPYQCFALVFRVSELLNRRRLLALT